jgi:hypothetical protein
MLPKYASIVAALVVSCALAAQAEAGDNGYGKFSIRNPSNVTIHYQIKWGNGDWTSHTVSPNSTRWHAHPLDGDGTAPTPQIRFDWIGGDGDGTLKHYELRFYAVDCQRHGHGKPYVFRYSQCGVYLDLYSA